MGDRTIKTPQIASTISPPRHVMASVERGKLGRAEKIALAGLAGFQGGAAWQGAVVAGASTRGYVSGDLQSVPRNSFSGELAAPTPLNPIGLSADAQAGMILRDAVTPWGAATRCWQYQDAATGRWHAVRDESDGNEDLPTPVQDTPEQAADAVKSARAVKAGKRVSAASEGLKITGEDSRVATVTEDRTEDLVSGILAELGFTGKITKQIRSLALDVLAQREQVAAYASR